jgi:uncharacterized membrane protein YgcG
MVVVGAYLRVFCTKRSAMRILEDVLHQETSYGGGRRPGDQPWRRGGGGGGGREGGRG